MDILLTDDEVRILGCLLEKELATPDYYPLTLNALINACSQKSNRNPVLAYDEETVVYALNGLKERNMIRQSNLSRVAKYEQIFSNELKLTVREHAVICVLLLRGPQTVGEIRNRTERLYSFADLEEVQNTLANLEDMKLTTTLPRQPGRKESRFAHLLSGQPQEATAPTTTVIRSKTSPSADRIEELEKEVAALRLEIQELQAEFTNFKLQFE